MTKDEEIIRQIILNWAASISSNDREGILEAHSANILMYDFPSVVRGLEAYDETWDFFFAEKTKEIHFDVRDLEVTASDFVAFATCLIRCEGTSAGVVELRLTTGLKKIDNKWIIIHEHHSVPTTDNKLIDERSKAKQVG
jgi:ketosteroid isomerase-like protein